IIIAYSCQQKINNENKLPVDTILHDTQLVIQEIVLIDSTPKKKDSIPIHVFKSGETLWQLAGYYYGNRHYSSIMQRYNNIEDERKIDTETHLKVPDLYFILHDEKFGLWPDYNEEIELLIQVIEIYELHERSLWNIRRRTNFKGIQNIPDSIKSDLQKAYELTEKIKLLQSNRSPEPERLIKRLNDLGTSIKSISEGANDGYGYDIDGINLKIVYVIHSMVYYNKTDSQETENGT
ncbi:hypothetical protein ACFLQ3_02610, partial [Bacteroidota bacterium]